MEKATRKSWFYRLHQNARDDSGAEMVEYVMMILFVMVAMAGMFSALNKALAGTMEASIKALQGEVHQAHETLKTARKDAGTAIQKGNEYREHIVNTTEGAGEEKNESN